MLVETPIAFHTAEDLADVFSRPGKINLRQEGEAVGLRGPFIPPQDVRPAGIIIT